MWHCNSLHVVSRFANFYLTWNFHSSEIKQCAIYILSSITLFALSITFIAEISCPRFSSRFQKSWNDKYSVTNHLEEGC